MEDCGEKQEKIIFEFTYYQYEGQQITQALCGRDYGIRVLQ